MGTEYYKNSFLELEHFCWQVSMGIPSTLRSYKVYERYYKWITRPRTLHFSFIVRLNKEEKNDNR